VRVGIGHEGFFQCPTSTLGGAEKPLAEQAGIGEGALCIVNPGQVAMAGSPVEFVSAPAQSQQAVAVFEAVSAAPEKLSGG